MESIIDAISWKDIISVLIGGLITWFVARVYYMRASEDLKKEATELFKLSTITLNALENAGICKLSKDETGKIAGLSLTIKVHDTLILSGKVLPPKVVVSESKGE
jgi:hypothetical protein